MAKLPESFDPKTAPFGWGSNQKTDNVGTQNQQNNDDVMEQRRKMEAEMAEKEKLFHATFPKEEEDYELSDEAMDRIIEENCREMGIIEPQTQPGASAWTSSPPEPVNNGWGRGWGSSNSASEIENESDDEQKCQFNQRLESKTETVSGIIAASADLMSGGNNRKGATKKYHFDEIEIGQAFRVACDSVRETSIRTSAYAAGKRLNKKFRVLKNGNYYEIGRIK